MSENETVEIQQYDTKVSCYPPGFFYVYPLTGKLIFKASSIYFHSRKRMAGHILSLDSPTSKSLYLFLLIYSSLMLMFTLLITSGDLQEYFISMIVAMLFLIFLSAMTFQHFRCLVPFYTKCRAGKQSWTLENIVSVDRKNMHFKLINPKARIIFLDRKDFEYFVKLTKGKTKFKL